MELVDEQKKKIGWALNAPFVDKLGEVASSFGRSGLKATCVEAAMLMFFEADHEVQADYIQRVERAELTGTVEEMVRGATEARLRIAAKRRPSIKSSPRRRPKS